MVHLMQMDCMPQYVCPCVVLVIGCIQHPQVQSQHSQVVLLMSGTRSCTRTPPGGAAGVLEEYCVHQLALHELHGDTPQTWPCGYPGHGGRGHVPLPVKHVAPAVQVGHLGLPCVMDLTCPRFDFVVVSQVLACFATLPCTSHAPLQKLAPTLLVAGWCLDTPCINPASHVRHCYVIGTSVLLRCVPVHWFLPAM